MGRKSKLIGHRVTAVSLALMLSATGAVPMNVLAAPRDSQTKETFSNPFIYSDVPDIDIIRVDGAYYMVSTTMHLSPGVPVMKSTDLVNWETVNYVYDRLDEGDEMNLRNGKSMYGKGQWASSIVYHNGTYYVGFNSNTTGTAYIFKTDDIEHGSWTRTKLNANMHDMAIFFDGDTPYVVWGGRNIQYQELEADMSGLKKDGKSGTLFTDDTASTIVNAEGTHVMKKGDYYYVFNIVWPNGGVRQEICHRSKTFPGTPEDWEKKAILDANFKNNGTSAGVAQGGIIDTEDGKWYGYLFQDHGAVGRVPVLTDCVFKDDWPMLGKNGDGKTVELTMDMPLPSTGKSSLTKSDEFYNDAEHRVFEEGYTGSDNAGSGSETIENNKPTPTVGKSTVELFTNGDVSTGTTEGWKVMEQADIDVALEDGSPAENEAEESDKNYCLWVKNRKACAGGAMQDISGKIEAGKEYTFKGRLKYVDGPDEKRFRVEIQNGPDYRWRDNVIEFTAKKGEWTEFEKTYTVPASIKLGNNDYEFNDDQNYIFIETPWVQDSERDANKDQHLMDYYLDDFSMTGESGTIVDNGDMEEGTQGWGKYQHKSVEGTINVEVTEDAHSGEKALKTKGREHTNDGLGQVFKNVFIPGYTYEFTAWVKQDEVESKEIAMTVRKGEGENFSTIDSKEVKKGEWTKLTGTYKFSEDDDTSVDTLFFETKWKQDSDTTKEDLVDIYVDDVAIIEKSRATEAEKAARGEDDYYGSDLDLAWQWNHNPDNTKWSLTDRTGWLRLTTGKKCESILDARNTLTQRTFGPTCSGTTKLDISNMKDGDVAGLAAFSYNYSYIAAKKENGKTQLVMVDATQNDSKKEDSPKEIASVPCEGNTVYLKDDYDFAGGDKVSFYYSFDGKEWTQLGETVRTSYELTHFMGSRFALFNYATKSKGGYVDFDYFRVSDAITGTENDQQDLSAGLSFSKSEISGVVNNEVEATVKLGKIEKASHNKIKASFEIPELMDVEAVEFNDAAINGEATYTFSKNRLVLEVTGDDVSFDAADGVFATIKLKLNGYVREDKTVDIAADYIRLDGGKAEVDASGAKASIKLTYLDTGAIAKKLGFSNPLVTQEYGADPYAIVYNDRVYVYMTADAAQYDANGTLKKNEYEYINTLRVISSSDMVNWTDHGEIKVAGKDGAANKWATNSWAPAIAHKKINGKDKFFVYFANNGSGIGVIEGDSPLGPWTDLLKKPLLTQSTPGCSGVVWCFDPAVLVDDDGKAYIYFGGGVPTGKQNNPKTARVAQLGDDMISIVGEAKEIDAPCMFEDSGIFKYKDKYYYSYCSNFTDPHKEGYPGKGNIAYMVSDNPMGPFTYAGEIFDNPGVWFGTEGNNHHATFVFRDKSYFIYHAQTVAKEKGEQKGYRSTHIDTIEMTPKGNIKPVKGTYEGISQLETVNPYETIEAETIAWNKGIKVKNIDDFHMELSSIDNGDWTSVAGVDFGEKGADKFTARVKSNKGGSIEVRLDSPEGSLIGTVKVPAGTKEYTDITTEVTPVAGEKNVFFVFKGEGSDIMTVDSYVFTEGEGGSVTPDKPTPGTPDKPTPSTPDKPTPSTPDKPTPSTPDTPTPSTPDTPTPSTPDTPTPSTPDTPTPGTPGTPDTPTPDAPTPVTPENPSKGETKPEDTTKPVSEPAAKASAGNGNTSTADQIAALGDTTTLASAESGKVTVNAGAKKLILKGDKGTFKVVKGKKVKVSNTGKLIFKKGASDCEVQFKVDGREVTKSIHVETPVMEKKVTVKRSETVALALTGTDIKTAVWSTNKTKDAKVSVSKDGKHVSVSYGKKGTIKVIAEINGKKYTTRVTFK